ncbi:unnamed protein product [Withania somnifera]
MRRKCNLELRLVPPCVSFSPNEYSNTTPCLPMGEKEGPADKQQKLTIFYDGQVVVSDATELQAKAIIHLASREMEEKIRTPLSLLEPPSLILQSQTGVSMKKSLQRFLEKRKNRAQAMSPYHH